MHSASGSVSKGRGANCSRLCLRNLPRRLGREEEGLSGGALDPFSAAPKRGDDLGIQVDGVFAIGQI